MKPLFFNSLEIKVESKTKNLHGNAFCRNCAKLLFTKKTCNAEWGEKSFMVIKCLTNAISISINKWRMGGNTAAR